MDKEEADIFNLLAISLYVMKFTFTIFILEFDYIQQQKKSQRILLANYMFTK